MQYHHGWIHILGTKAVHRMNPALNYCSCPDFRYRRRGRGTECRHLRRYRELNDDQPASKPR